MFLQFILRHSICFPDANKYPVSVPYEDIPTCERSNIKLVMPPNSVVYSTPVVGTYSSSTPSDDTPTNQQETESESSGFESASTEVGAKDSQNGSIYDSHRNEDDFFR